ncbi:hypothetical protein KAU51_00260 [Candidatus Parcubacteria bacterium]|nr:hypothetical protein [Candidatus Parcubacteria bacterium]
MVIVQFSILASRAEDADSNPIRNVTCSIVLNRIGGDKKMEISIGKKVKHYVTSMITGKKMEMSIGERVKYHVTNMVTGLIFIAVAWTLDFGGLTRGLTICLYVTGSIFVYLGTTLFLLDRWYLSRNYRLYSLEDI